MVARSFKNDWQRFNDVLSGNSKRRLPKPTPNITPDEIFQRELINDSRFEMLLGRSKRSLFTQQDGSVKWGWVRYPERTEQSDFYRFSDGKAGHFSIIQIPSDGYFQCATHLQNLFVREEWGQRGIATNTLSALQEISQKVDERVQQEERYQDTLISGNHHALWLWPVPFEVPSWQDDQFIDEVDWSRAKDAEADMIDDAFELLENPRLGWRELREFYKSRGWVEVNGGRSVQVWVEEFNKEITRSTITSRTTEIDRKMLIWPPHHSHHYQEEDKEK